MLNKIRLKNQWKKLEHNYSSSSNTNFERNSIFIKVIQTVVFFLYSTWFLWYTCKIKEWMFTNGKSKEIFEQFGEFLIVLNMYAYWSAFSKYLYFCTILRTSRDNFFGINQYWKKTRLECADFSTKKECQLRDSSTYCSIPTRVM